MKTEGHVATLLPLAWPGIRCNWLNSEIVPLGYMKKHIRKQNLRPLASSNDAMSSSMALAEWGYMTQISDN